MKVMIFLCAWKRPEITKACYKGIHRIKKTFAKNGVKTDVFVTVSEDYHAELAEQNGFKWTMTDNFPVGQKHHNGLQAALGYDWDYIMQMGSDDIITDHYIDTCCKYLGSYDVFGTNYYYFYNIETGECVNIKMNGRPPGGAGRFLKRQRIQTTLDKLGFFWQRQFNRKLDGSSWQVMHKAEAIRRGRKRSKLGDISWKCISFKNPQIVDVKGKDSMNSFDVMKMISEEGELLEDGSIASGGGFKIFPGKMDISCFKELKELVDNVAKS